MEGSTTQSSQANIVRCDIVNKEGMLERAQRMVMWTGLVFASLIRSVYPRGRSGDTGGGVKIRNRLSGPWKLPARIL